MAKKIGLFVGSFDPLTNGHLDIIQRASKLFDTLYVGILENDQKQLLFRLADRKKMLADSLEKYDKITLISADSRELTTTLADRIGATALVRAVRNADDLHLEQSLAWFNRNLTGIETIWLPTRPEFENITSTRIRELAHFQGDVTPYVPENVARALRTIYNPENK